MTYRPMLFDTPMVCAIEDGTKTQTRRLVQLPKNKDWELLDVRPNPDLPGRFWQAEINGTLTDVKKRFTLVVKAPCVPGDVLWVRETWKQATTGTAGPGLIDLFLYKADEPQDTTGMMVEGRWHPAIHMPKKAARLFLRVVGVRAERLQDMDEDDVCDEGADRIISACEHMDYGVMPPEPCFNVNPCKDCIINHSYPELFGKMIWNKTIKPADLHRFGWAANPWVWVIEFERIEKTEGWPNVRQ